MEVHLRSPPLPGPTPRPSPPVTQICAGCGHGHLAPPPVPHRRSRLGRQQTPAHPKRCESLHSPCSPGPGALTASCVVLGWAGGESETPTEAAHPERSGPRSVPRPVLRPPHAQCRRAGGNGLGLTQVPPTAGHELPHDPTAPHQEAPENRDSEAGSCAHVFTREPEGGTHVCVVGEQTAERLSVRRTAGQPSGGTTSWRRLWHGALTDVLSERSRAQAATSVQPIHRERLDKLNP